MNGFCYDKDKKLYKLYADIPVKIYYKTLRCKKDLYDKTLEEHAQDGYVCIEALEVYCIGEGDFMELIFVKLIKDEESSTIHKENELLRDIVGKMGILLGGNYGAENSM